MFAQRQGGLSQLVTLPFSLCKHIQPLTDKSKTFFLHWVILVYLDDYFFICLAVNRYEYYYRLLNGFG